jgi:glutamyl-tRNA synthetase
MERLALYKEHAERLIAEKKAYRCTCTKEMLEEARVALKAKDPKATFVYPGTCRDANRPASEKHVVRFKAPIEGSVEYEDLVFGKVVTPNSAQQDFVLLRTDGVPLYNFGAVVDDLTMKITLVARGRDHMVNTPPQILLYRAFGAEPPRFAHLPMMLAPSGEKLSKRHGAVSVAEYSSGGYAPTALLNYLVRFGWSFGDEEVFSLQDMIDKFDWTRCTRSDGKFDAKKLLAINHEHLKQERLTSSDAYIRAVIPFLEQRGLSRAQIDDARLAKAVPVIRERARTYLEAADALDYFFRDEPVFDAKAEGKFLVPAAAQGLDELAAVVDGVAEWTLPAIEAAILAYLTPKNLQIKDVAQPSRVSLTGRSASPGLYETIEILGKATSVARLRSGAAKARAAQPK